MVVTIAMARTLHPGAKHSLDALCTRYGIDRSHRIKHGALLDAELLAQLYIELTGGRQIGFALATDIPATQAERTTAKPHIRIIRPARAHRASRSEEHTSELQSLMRISYAVFCLKKKKHNTNYKHKYKLHQ